MDDQAPDPGVAAGPCRRAHLLAGCGAVPGWSLPGLCWWQG